MIIEEINEKNLDEVTELAIKLWPNNIWSELKNEFEELIKSNKDMVYLAVIENKYIGFIHVSLRIDYVEGCSSNPVGYIEGIYVGEDYRNIGISRKLIEAGEVWLKSLGCIEIASDTDAENYGSQDFHKKIGFKETGKIVTFIKNIE